MIRVSAKWLCFVSAVFMAACRPTPVAKPAGAFSGVQLGTSLAEAQKQAGSDGEEREYAKLSTTIKPRDVYPKLPADTHWRVWSGNQKPILMLGIVNDRVVYREIIRNESGKLISDSTVVPEYQ